VHSHSERELIWNTTQSHTAQVLVKMIIDGFEKTVTMDNKFQLLLIEGGVEHQIFTNYAEYYIITTAKHDREYLMKKKF